MSTRALAVVLSLSACGFPVKVGELAAETDDLSSSSTSDPTSSTDPTFASSSSESGDVPPMVPHEYALRLGDAPDPGSTDTGASASTASTTVGTSDESTGDDPNDPFGPDALLVIASNGADTCEDPYGAGCGEHWRISINLPPALQVAGAAGSLEEVNGFFSVIDSPECGGGGGSLSGNYEITAIDEDHVVGQLTGLDGFFLPFTEIAFDAPRC